jgi:hypothetical protein
VAHQGDKRRHNIICTIRNGIAAALVSQELAERPSSRNDVMDTQCRERSVDSASAARSDAVL